MTDTTIRKSIFIAASRDTVWQYLTEAKLLGAWFHPARSDLADGEDYTLVSQNDGDRMCWGKVTEMNGAMSQVEWTLVDAPGGTRLTLEHSGLPETADAFGLVLALDKGWHGFLSNFQGLEL